MFSMSISAWRTLGINKAEEVQRLIQLQQIGVDQHEVADRHPPWVMPCAAMAIITISPIEIMAVCPRLIAVKLNWF